MIIDYTILSEYTVEELDRLHDGLGMPIEWRRSEQRRLLAQREVMELDIIMKLEDNHWGIPLVSKVGKAMREDRGEVSASLEHDREIHDPKEILWSNKKTD